MKQILAWFDQLKTGKLVFPVSVLVGGFFLWTEHQAHIMGELPYLIFLLCPLMHLFMHKGHDKKDGGNSHHH